MDFFDAVVAIWQQMVNNIIKIWNIIVQSFNFMITIFDYAINIIVFVVNIVAQLIKFLYNVFMDIFTNWFFQTFRSWSEWLAVFIGTDWVNVLLVLVMIVFLLIVFGFVLRLMKWSLHYKNTSNKLSKK